MFMKRSNLAVVLSAVLALSGCASTGSQYKSYDDSVWEDDDEFVIEPEARKAETPLEELQLLDGSQLEKISKDKASGIRLDAMREAALVVGAQRAYTERMKGLRAKIEGESSMMDELFDFRALMMLASDGTEEKYLIPPVIQEAKDAFAVEDSGQLLKVSGTVFRVVKPEKLVSAPMTWREYLFPFNDTKGNLPHKALLPKSQVERELWSEWVADGWKAGLSQADSELKARIRSLGRDFKGMVYYMVLLERGLVKAPVVAVSNERVVGGGSKMMVRNSTYRLTMPASLNSKMEDWKFIELGSRKSLRLPSELSY